MKSSLSQLSRTMESLQTEVTALEEQKKHLQATNKTLSERQRLASQSLRDDLEALKQKKLKEIADEIKPLERDKATLTTKVDQLAVDKQQLEDSIVEKSGVLKSLNKDVETARRNLSDVEDKIPTAADKLAKLRENADELKAQIKAHEGSISALETKIAGKETELAEAVRDTLKAQGDLDDLQKDYETRKAGLDDDLKTILVQTQDAITRLKQLRNEEEMIRSGIATERLTLDKERQALNVKQAKLSGADARIAKANQMLKL